jgi:uncharacterized repeat protein (TIGR01451 family)
MNKSLIHKLWTILMALALLVAISPRPAYAQRTIPVAVTIYRLMEIDNPDEFPAYGFGDYYSRVRINGFAPQQSSVVSRDPGFGEGVIYTPPLTFETSWTFFRIVPNSLGSVIITIALYDSDDLDDDEHMDISPVPGVRDLTLSLDLATGNWTGDIPMNQPFSQGDGDDARARILFDISTLSTTGDADGDGLLDGWETAGYDADGVDGIDVDLPAFGADPNHKDLFLELDWMPGNAPTRLGIQRMKAAFASAPTNAGTNAATLCNPSCGTNANANPDGLPGINLWVDTGTLADPTAGEDGAAAGTCGDGLDNGSDGLTDSNDPDCLVGDNLEGGNQLPLSTPVYGVDPGFYALKGSSNFTPTRASVFRYAISSATFFEDGTTNAGTCTDGMDNDGDGTIDRGLDADGDGTLDVPLDPKCVPTGGQGELGGNDFVDFNHDGGTIMHELGHNLNLGHGGNSGDNCKPNYVSVMNYDSQGQINQVGGGGILDYSPPRWFVLGPGRGSAPIANLVENNLNEAVILDATDPLNFFVFRQYQPAGSETGAAANTCSDGIDNNGDGLIDNGLDTDGDGTIDIAGDPACYLKVRSRLAGADIDGDGTVDGVDWDGDGSPTAGSVTANIDSSGNVALVVPPMGAPVPPNFQPAACTNTSNTSTLTGFNDWLAISIPFRGFGDSADSAINPVTGPEPTLEELRLLQEQLNTADLAISKTGSADPALAGEPLVYTLSVANHGPNPADSVQVEDVLPAGVAYQSNDAGCVEDPAGALSCDLGQLLAGESREIAVNVLVDPEAEAGSITNLASVENLAGPDPDPSTNSAELTTEVISRGVIHVDACHDQDADGACDADGTALPAGVQGCLRGDLSGDLGCKPVEAVFRNLDPDDSFTPYLSFTGASQGHYPTTHAAPVRVGHGEVLTQTVGAVYPVHPKGVAVHAPLNKVYVAFQGPVVISGTETTKPYPFVAVIDGETDHVLYTVPGGPDGIGRSPWGVAVSGDQVYVSSFEDGWVSVIDANSDTVLDNVAPARDDFQPTVAVVNPTTGWVHVSDFKAGRMVIIDNTDLIADIRIHIAPASFNPFEMVVADDGLQGHSFATMRGALQPRRFKLASLNGESRELSHPDIRFPDGRTGTPFAIGLWQEAGASEPRLFVTYADDPRPAHEPIPNPNKLVIYGFPPDRPRDVVQRNSGLLVGGDHAEGGLIYDPTTDQMIGTFGGFFYDDGVESDVACSPVERGGTYTVGFDGAVLPGFAPTAVVGNPPLEEDDLDWKNPFEMAVGPDGKIYVTDRCWNDFDAGGVPGGGAVLIARSR